MNDDEQIPWAPADVLSALLLMGDRAAVVSIASGRSTVVSGSELHGRTIGMAAALTEAGIECGSVVAIWAPNSAAWIAAGLACHYLGVVFAPIDALLSANEAVQQVVENGATLVLVEKETAPAFSGKVTCRDLWALPTRYDAPPARVLTGDQSIAQFRTSGTTGTPKVFRLTLINIGWNVRAICRSGLVTPDDRVLMPLPMHHVFPWITATLTCLTVGATLILPEGLTGPQIVEALRLGRPTAVIGVPRLFESMLAGIRDRLRAKGRVAVAAYDGSLGLVRKLQQITQGRLGRRLLAPMRRAVATELRLLVSGGAHLPRDVQESLEALGWDVRVGYGLAETAASVAGTLVEKRGGSVGQPIAGCEVRVADQDSAGVGEILLRGPMVFGGYIDNPKANAEAFTKDGYFRTGDLGRLDNDGFLYVTGRKKELIVLAGGDKLYPEDVEQRYLADERIAKIGVMERNGALVALVVPNLGVIAKTGAMQPEDAIRVALGTVATRLPSTWRLSGFVLTRQPLPRTRLGKIRRFRLPELYDCAGEGRTGTTRAPSAEEQTWIETPPRAAVWAIMRREFRSQPFDLDSHIQLDLGLDSFGWMELALAINEATGVRLETADIAAIATVRDLLVCVSEKPAKAGDRGPDLVPALARERARWLAPRTAIERLFGGVFQVVNSGAMQWLFRLRVAGAESLPETGPLLICPNHVSDMDAFVVAAALPHAVRRRVVWAASRQRLFHTALFRAFSRSARIFPVDENAPTIAVDLAVETLANGGAQVWFPEGWRSPDGQLLPFHAGVGHVVLRSRAPVVAAYISGTLEAWPRDRRFPRPSPVTITFAPPVSADALIAGLPEGENRAQEIADALRERVAQIAAMNSAQSQRRQHDIGDK